MFYRFPTSPNFPSETRKPAETSPKMMERKRMYRDEDPTNPPQSRVIHVRNLSPTVNEADLIDALSMFGTIAYSTCMPNKQMALVEFEEMESARQCVKVSQENPVEVAGVPALFNYSTSQIIQRGSLESEKPNHVLALTVSNAKYPINARVIHRACSPCGTIIRIAVMKRNFIQALVEFETTQVAVDAKKTLNGADIYPDCCTLKVEYARADCVKINKQTLDHWDYTLDSEGPPLSLRSDDQSMFVDKEDVNFPNAAQQQLAQQQAINDTVQQDHYQQQQYDDYSHHGQRGNRFDEMEVDRAPAAPGKFSRKYPPPNFDNSVAIMVYGIDQEQFDCDRLFNLFCCYGNVSKVKFLKSKKDTAMVQMANQREANNIMRYLENAPVFGTRLSFQQSKQNIVHSDTEAFNLSNGKTSFCDYTNCRNHRFSTAASASRNRIVYPTEQLHFFNLPLHYDVENVRTLLAESGLNGPMPLEIVPFYVKMAHSLSGLVTFENPEKALEALMLYNHLPVPDANEDDPPMLKLTLSSSPKDEYAGQY